MGCNMKGYFNQYEASNHLVLMTAMLSVQNFLDGNCITEEERKILKKVMKLVSDFSESVFERLGEGYKKSLTNKANLNTLRIVSKDIHHKNNADMADFVENEFLLDMMEEIDQLECTNCNNENCKNCKIYKIKTHLRYKGNSDDTNLCPFRLEGNKYDFLEGVFDEE